MRGYRVGLVFAVSLLGVSAATDTLEEAQEACKDLEDLERCHGLCVYLLPAQRFDCGIRR